MSVVVCCIVDDRDGSSGLVEMVHFGEPAVVVLGRVVVVVVVTVTVRVKVVIVIVGVL